MKQIQPKNQGPVWEVGREGLVDGWVGCGGWEGSKECEKIAKALISPPEFWFNRSWVGPGHLHFK